MKSLIYIIMLTFLITSCYERKEMDDLSFINNKKLTYTFVFFVTNEKGFEYRVQTNLNHTQRNIVKKMKPNQWLKLLNNENTDFASNLILYELYDIEATNIFYSKLRGCRGNKQVLAEYQNWWKNTRKKSDITFWEKLLRLNSK